MLPSGITACVFLALSSLLGLPPDLSADSGIPTVGLLTIQMGLRRGGPALRGKEEGVGTTILSDGTPFSLIQTPPIGR